MYGDAMSHSFRIVTRKKNDYKDSILVFGSDEYLHFPLTTFASEALKRFGIGTTRTYVNAITPFFRWLETDEWQQQAVRHWDDASDQVRIAIQDYLIGTLKCKMKEHGAGFQLVYLTDGTRSTVRVFLSALKLFYRVMHSKEMYKYDDPLVDGISKSLSEIEDRIIQSDATPQMPQISGVVEPRKKQRLSDSYFKLSGDIWIPQVIDDPQLPARVFAGGRKIGWRLREQCITRILFESGGRISEVVGLTLGDWIARGGLQEAQAFSKGSHGRRVKFLRFSAITAKLLRRYFDTERRQIDPHNYNFNDYLQLAKNKKLPLYEVPMFLSQRKTMLNPKTFRDCYWNQGCQAAGIDADIHQCRHWYTTQAVRAIYETTHSDTEIQRRLRELIEYMSWRSGKETLEAYQHYFDPLRHAEVQNHLHMCLDLSLKQSLQGKKQTKQTTSYSDKLNQSASDPEMDVDLKYLLALGNQHANG